MIPGDNTQKTLFQRSRYTSPNTKEAAVRPELFKDQPRIELKTQNQHRLKIA